MTRFNHEPVFAMPPAAKTYSPPLSLVPNLKDEIDRKADETLNWLITSALQDKIDEREFSLCLDVLFMAVSGLAGKDFIEKITKVEQLLLEARVPQEVAPAPVVKLSGRSETYDTW